MKLINLETILWSLETMTHVITLPADVREKAGAALKKMMAADLPVP
jgi:quinolinate synthase